MDYLALDWRRLRHLSLTAKVCNFDIIQFDPHLKVSIQELQAYSLFKLDLQVNQYSWGKKIIASSWLEFVGIFDDSSDVKSCDMLSDELSPLNVSN